MVALTAVTWPVQTRDIRPERQTGRPTYALPLPWITYCSLKPQSTIHAGPACHHQGIGMIAMSPCQSSKENCALPIVCATRELSSDDQVGFPLLMQCPAVIM